MKPFFSIIIPLYNKEKHIKNSLDSVLDQSCSNFEVIVINDGSTDNSLDIVDTIIDERIKVYSIKNSGVSTARNYGIKKAQADYVAFLDADDFWEHNFLEHINRLIRNYPKEHIFATALKIKTNKNSYFASYKNLDLSPNQVQILNYFKFSIDHSILHCSSSVLSKKAIEKVGEFNENLNTGEDTEYWIRVGLKYQVVFLNTPLATHLVVDDGLTKSNRKKFTSINFSNYDNNSNQSDYFKYYINKNKFSSAIKYKLVGDTFNFQKLKNEIDIKKLNFKQKLLLNSPLFITKLIINSYNLISFKKNYF
ncbi:glycosyltransferase family 2 protein [Xanthomarina sp. F2636L]|uniref:glycosyltransferase family 2 protein n=1 Tax=Xanthomarina sp. F2636L TaxID=2996018 RepID=UPI00225E214C|nr:glycosyltransferase family 2 protein [Xanthomarina sp. F2636L]MCX7550555.1 glycosyltransferase family 2 protein [Xanthomarina sp. F2636L]